MASLQKIYKIVDAVPQTRSITDSQDLTGSTMHSMHSWYQRLVHGSSTRITRYREYDNMDDDVDVSRALDIIAEEMTNLDPSTKLPVLVDMQNGDERASESSGIALRAAIRHWCNLHQWESRLFTVCRNTIKYGDCIFLKDPKMKGKWEYLYPDNVIAAVVDEDDVTKIQGLMIRRGNKEANRSSGGGITVSSREQYTEFVPAEQVVIFTLNDDMSTSAPFGESILRPVYKSHRQKSLLEDAIIIYRVSRAPERRVFYIDVGKMAPARVKTYLEGIKNEIKQKKIPSRNANGDSQVESVYNPHSMQEDFYFAQRPDGKGSRVETLPGGAGLGELSDLEYFQGKVWEGLRVPASYMSTSRDSNPIFNDGRSGQSYVEELRFMFFVKRLQRKVERAMDKEFKSFLKLINVNIDPALYKIRLPEGENFYKYREFEVQQVQLSNIASADGIPFLSKRWILSHVGQMREDEILSNEKWLREERNIAENDPDIMAKLYTDGSAEGSGSFAGDLGGTGGGFGGGDADMTADKEDFFGDDTPDLGDDAGPLDEPDEKPDINIPDNPESNT